MSDDAQESEFPVKTGEPTFTYRAFNGISRVMNPVYLAPPGMLAISLKSVPATLEAIAWWCIYLIFSTVIPLADLTWRRKTGRISDWHISRREERPVPMLFGIFYALLGIVTLYLLGAPEVLKACMVTGLATGVIALLITLGWKISLHTMGDTLLATLIALVFKQPWYSPLNVLMALAVIMTGVSRRYLRKHTVPQIIGGAVLGASLGVAVFYAYGLI